MRVNRYLSNVSSIILLTYHEYDQNIGFFQLLLIVNITRKYSARLGYIEKILSR
jgi:hypothetical protein